ncbi:MAG: hypothetical protein BWX86_02092 [Verrucomicrobia bacterium ADurb.Bin122]|nr:MAG: hypothetical protein BWX86_02092 [Verrucomicrobia bacterium ADurb.Bin122]
MDVGGGRDHPQVNVVGRRGDGVESVVHETADGVVVIGGGHAGHRERIGARAGEDAVVGEVGPLAPLRAPLPAIVQRGGRGGGDHGEARDLLVGAPHPIDEATRLLRDDRRGAGRRRSATNRVVGRIGHVKLVARTKSQPVRRSQERSRPGPIGGAGLLRRAGHGQHLARRRHAAQRRGIGIRHVEIAHRVERQTAGPLETRHRARAVRRPMAANLTGKRRHGAGCIDAPERGVARVGDKDHAAGIDRHGERMLELHGRARAVGRAHAVEGRVARHRRHDAGWRHAADHVVERVGDDEVAGAVKRQSVRLAETRRRARTIE